MNVKKTLATGITIASLLATMAMPSFAANDKASLYDSPAFTCPSGATSTTGSTFGFVNINEQHGNLQIEVAVKGGTPNSSYDIYVNEDPGGCPALPSNIFPGVLTTDSQGNGNVHVSVAQVPGAVNYWVSAVGGGQVLRSMAVQ